MQPHDDDLRLFRILHQVGVADTRQLLLSAYRHANARAARRRLEQLFHAEYLRRPREQYRRRAIRAQRSVPYLYANTAKAHRLLFPADHRAGRSPDPMRHVEEWERQIEHELGLTEAMLCILVAAGDLDWLLFELHHARHIHAATPVPRHVRFRVGDDPVTLALRPDCFFAVDLDPQPADENGRRRLGRPMWFFLEHDEGTEPYSRSHFWQTSIRQKMIAYWQLYEQQVLKRFGISNFRVLFTTTDAGHRDGLRDVVPTIHPKRRPTGLFLFTTHDEVRLEAPERFFSQPIWHPADPAAPARLLTL